MMSLSTQILFDRDSVYPVRTCTIDIYWDI